MLKLRWIKMLFLAGLLQVPVTCSVYAADAPPKIAAAIIVKLAAFEQKMMSVEGDIAIQVLGSSEVGDALKTFTGNSIGKRKLASITVNDLLPTEKPDILWLTDETKINETINYTRKEHVLSVTNKPELVKQGISLGIGIGDDGKPTILINIAASKKEGLKWNPAILKMATIVH